MFIHFNASFSDQVSLIAFALMKWNILLSSRLYDCTRFNQEGYTEEDVWLYQSLLFF